MNEDEKKNSTFKTMTIKELQDTLPKVFFYLFYKYSEYDAVLIYFF